MTSVLALESFDMPALPDVTTDEGPPAGYDEGFAAGQAAAAQTYETDQARLRDDVVQSLNECAFTYQEAQAHFTQNILPLITTMLDVILPQALTPALFAQVHDILTDAAAKDAQAPMTLMVPPDQSEAITRILGEFDMPHVRLNADPALTGASAWISTIDGETALDLDAALSALQNTLGLLTETQQEVS